MHDAFFSEFLLLESPTTAYPKRRAKAKAGVDKAQAALTDVLARAIEASGLLVAADAAGVKLAATAMADVALGRSVALRLNPKLADEQRNAAKLFLEKVIQVSDNLEASRLEAAIGKLADVILPDDLGAARGAIATDNLALRDRFLAEVPCLTSAEVGKLAGHTAANPYATAARWKKAGDIFSVNHRGGEYFPTFQFRDGRPHPAVKRVLAALPASLTAWQRALWFVSTNGWLSDKAPCGLLDEPEALIAAAKREGEDVVG
jgi:hypothetical protein